MKPKILTVDDSKTIRMIVGRAFKSFDCEIFEAADGVEGLAMATNHKPNLILLDLTMPVMDGVDMLGRLRANNELKHIPVIMLTAEAGRETVLKIAKMGVRDYIVKPFKEDFLIERVTRVVELSSKNDVVAKVRRFDDPLKILVVDNKPAIIEQVQQGLATTNWKVHGCTQTGEAVDYCNQNPVDIIIISLSLPENAAFTLFQLFRSSHKTRAIPIIGMSVKTAAEEQTRAQQAGFSAVVTKPIDFDNLQHRVVRALNLDISYRYFEERSGVFVVKLPEGFNSTDANTVSAHLRAKLSEAVDAGLEKAVFDLSKLTSHGASSGDVGLIHLGLEIVKLCEELSLKFRIVCSGPIAQHLGNFEEIKASWLVGSFEGALADWSKTPVPA